MTDKKPSAPNTPILGITGWSGSGKTTLLTKVIPLLANQGIRSAVIKHTHHDIEIDTPGKDSYELYQSGASQMVIATNNQIFLRYRYDSAISCSYKKSIEILDHKEIDLIFIEGYKGSMHSKLEVHRKDLGKPLMYPDDKMIIGVISDLDFKEVDPKIHIQLGLDDLSALEHFILDFINGNIETSRN